MKLLITNLLFILFCANSVFAQTARVQIIHNSPTPTVDIYAGTAKLVDNFAFRTATPYIDVPANVQIPIGVALGSSTASTDAIATFPVTFEAGKTYVVVAGGTVGGTPGFNLFVFDKGRETSQTPGNVDLLLFHGSPDAPQIDVVTGGSPVFDNVSFGNFSANYVSVPAATYNLDITPGNNNASIVASYKADLGFAKGGAAVVFASGFLGGAGDKSFEPWVALPGGGTFPLQKLGPNNPPPPPPSTEARIQIIHNSPTPTVDIYAGTAKLLDNFAFRTATPFVTVPAGVQINIGVAGANSTSSADAIANFPVTFEGGKRYIIVAGGVVGGTPGFNLFVFDKGREQATTGTGVDLLFFHGAPDAPQVDIIAGGNPIFDNISFGGFSADYINVPANSYKLGVTPGNDNANVLASYQADLNFWNKGSAVVFASGFLGGGSAAFQPWVALSNGGTFGLPQVPNFDAPDDDIFLQKRTVSSAFNAYPNPVRDELTIDFELEKEADVQILLMNQSGQIVRNLQAGTLYEGQNQQFLTVANLPTGIYSLQIRSENGIQTTRISVLK